MNKRSKSKKKKSGRKSGRFIAAAISAITLAGAACVLFFWADILAFVAGFERYYGGFKLPDAQVVGIDISHYQEDIEWDEIRFRFNPVTRELDSESDEGVRAIDFVVAKATEGANMADKHYAVNKISAESRGMVFGAYHFFVPSADISRQAANFIRNANLRKGNLVPVIDVERCGRLSIAEMQKAVIGLCNLLKEHYGRNPLIYCDLKYYFTYFSSSKFEGYKFWIAAYSRSSLIVDYAFWQQTDAGRIPGIKGAVDIDVFNGTREEFSDFIL